jgi:hypothetical protein
LALKKVVRLYSPSSTDKTISLGYLFLAVQLAGILWPILVLKGIEKVAIAPGITAAQPLDFVSYPFTHRLLASFFWAAPAFFLVKWLPIVPGSNKMRVALIMGIGCFHISFSI